MNAQLMCLHVLSPLHCGTGQAVGGIDLPIARERPTRVPLVPGSALKGVLRAECDDKATQWTVFGPDTKRASDHAGSVQFSDLSLVFLPVRSLRGTFSWVTSAHLLQRLARDAKDARLELDVPQGPPTLEGALVASSERLLVDGSTLVLEDYDFTSTGDHGLAKLAKTVGSWAFEEGNERKLFVERVSMVHDDMMSTLLETAMEIRARIRMQADTKTVARGALWTEEALPRESLLFGLVIATPLPRKGDQTRARDLLNAVDALIEGRTLQLGGNATVGQGLCRLAMQGGHR